MYCCPQICNRFSPGCRVFLPDSMRAPAATDGTSCKSHEFPAEWEYTACHCPIPARSIRRRRQGADRQSPWACRCRGSREARVYFSCLREHYTNSGASQTQTDRSCKECFRFSWLFLLSHFGFSTKKGNKKDLHPQRKPAVGLISWDKSLKTSAVPPKLTISCPLMTRLHASSPVTVGLRQRLLAYTFSLPSAAHSANVFLLPSHQPATL